MVVKIRLFGALKKFGNLGVVVLDLPDECVVQQVREAIKQKLSGEFPGVFQAALVDRSAVADNNRVLANDEQLGQLQEIALLPPVCGG